MLNAEVSILTKTIVYIEVFVTAATHCSLLCLRIVFIIIISYYDYYYY